MLSDLGRDWSSGPHGDYHRFIPMEYVVDLDFQNFELTTNLNDQNIIDKPLIKEENGLSYSFFLYMSPPKDCFIALLTFRGLSLRSNVRIPLTKYRPDSTMVSFWVDAPDLTVGLTLQRWNTHSLFPTPHRAEIGRVGKFYVDASYRYYAEVHLENVDRLRLSFTVRFKPRSLHERPSHTYISRLGAPSTRLAGGQYGIS